MAVLPSPLSSSIGSINQNTVSGNVFSGAQQQDPETKSKFESLTFSITSLQNQVNELNRNNINNINVFTNFQKSFSIQIESVKSQLSKVDETLESVANIIASESTIEKQKDLYEQAKEKRLSESNIRGGKEDLLETKIQSALAEPINRIGNKISFGFQNLMSFVYTLLGGWLTVQGIEALKAYQEGDKKTLEDIKNRVIKTLLIAGGIFGIINVGIGKVISTITNLGARIAKFVFDGVILSPFRALMNGLGGNKPQPPSEGPGSKKPGSKGPVAGPNFLGGALNLYTAIRNLGNGEITDAVMQGILAGLLFTPAGRLVSAIRTILGVSVTADEIAEVFGSNIFGENPDILRDVNKIKEKAEKEAQENKKNPPVTSPNTEQSKVPNVQPKTPMTPPASNLQIKPPETPSTTSTPSSTPTTSSGSTPTPTTPTQSTNTSPTTMSGADVKPLDQSKIKQYEMAWKYRDNPMARGRIEGAWNKMSLEEKQQAKAWAESQGHDWRDMKLPEPIDATKVESIPPKKVEELMTTQSTPQTSPPPSTSSEPTITSAETTPKPITQAETSKVPLVPFNVGPEPEPKPNIIYASSGSSTSQPQQPLNVGAASDVPIISSSNPDNFYVLYSQINYNVVM